MPPFRCRVAGACAFTLIELLVVIGIVALLVGILLPALAGARRTARLAQCASQLKQMQAGTLAYTTDNREFPRTKYNADDTAEAYSDDWSLGNPFDAGMESNVVSAAIWLLARTDYLASIAIFSCPSADSEPIDQSIDPKRYADFPGTPITADSRRGLHYGYTNPYGRPPAAIPELKTNVRLSMKTVNPRLVTFADQGPDCCGTAGYGYSGGRGTSFNHGYKGQNVARADGSTEWEPDTNRVGIHGDNIYMGVDEVLGEAWTYPAPAVSYDDASVTPHFDDGGF